LSYGAVSAADLATISGATFTQSAAQIRATYEAQGYRCERPGVMDPDDGRLDETGCALWKEGFPFPTRIRVRCGPCVTRKTTRC
jgi:hypothetical protein